MRPSLCFPPGALLSFGSVVCSLLFRSEPVVAATASLCVLRSLSLSSEDILCFAAWLGQVPPPSAAPNAQNPRLGVKTGRVVSVFEHAMHLEDAGEQRVVAPPPPLTCPDVTVDWEEPPLSRPLWEGDNPPVRDGVLAKYAARVCGCPPLEPLNVLCVLLQKLDSNTLSKSG